MSWVTTVVGVLAPVFIAVSPILSYGDQALAIHRSKSSAGFSLDIPLIMLVASLFRIFYWAGARYDISLLIQSLIMIVIQAVLLKLGLDHRPSPSTKGGEASLPFNGAEPASNGFIEALMNFERPYNFWQWKSHKPYWHFLMYLFAALCVLQLLLGPLPDVYVVYSSLLGYIGLSVEAMLPLPQILANFQLRACKGFRLSVLGSWLIGDAMKMFWFFTSTTEIPWAFKICGIFQAACDSFLGFQYFLYETSTGAQLLQVAAPQFDDQYQMQENNRSENNRSESDYKPPMHGPTRSLTPTRRPAPFSDDDDE